LLKIQRDYKHQAVHIDNIIPSLQGVSKQEKRTLKKYISIEHKTNQQGLVRPFRAVRNHTERREKY
jgi:hypothetical protein